MTTPAPFVPGHGLPTMLQLPELLPSPDDGDVGTIEAPPEEE